MRLINVDDIVSKIGFYECPIDIYQPISYKIEEYRKKQYLDIFACFDIETSIIYLDGEPNAIIYCWSLYDGINAYFGRTWEDYKKLCYEIENTYGLSEKRRMVVYCHNLPYEFQFLSSVFDIREVFAVDTRKVVKCLVDDCFEYRCSYKLTNMSLARFCQSEQVPVSKLKGYDYNKLRYSDTPMSDFEVAYSLVDTICCHQSLSKLMQSEGDTITTIPLTSTGYVRREARKKVLANPDNHKQVVKNKLSDYEYKLCKSAVRGGNTHCTYLYTGQALTQIYSHDRVSSYPHVMLTALYPVTKFYRESDAYLKTITAPPDDLCCVMLVEYTGIKLRRETPIPYIPYAKCSLLRGTKHLNDNGRVVYADYIVMSMTEIDFSIIDLQYTYDSIRIIDMLVAERGYLNKEYREYVKEMFVRKCELKHGDKYFYDKIKNKVNALFGMMLTDITREQITWSFDYGWGADLPDIAKELLKYYNNQSSFLQYQQGIYVTAHARAALQDSIDICGFDTVYVDTDSNKHINDHREDFAKLNAKIHQDNLACDISPYCDINGEHFELGLWEDEGEGGYLYEKFVSFGAKKYIYQYKNGNYGVTIAGLNKDKGKETLKAVGIDAIINQYDNDYTDIYVFDAKESGRLTAVYNDSIPYQIIMHDGHIVELTSNVALIPSTYTLGVTTDYLETAKKLQMGLDNPV